MGDELSFAEARDISVKLTHYALMYGIALIMPASKTMEEMHDAHARLIQQHYRERSAWEQHVIHTMAANMGVDYRHAGAMTKIMRKCLQTS